MHTLLLSAAAWAGQAFLDQLLMLPVPSSEHSTKGVEQGGELKTVAWRHP